MLEAEMAIQAPVKTPLRNRFKRRKGEGSAHSWYKLIPTTSAGAQSDGHLFVGGTEPESMFFDKGGLPNAKQPTYKHVAAPYASIGDMANVSFFDYYAGKTYNDLKADQIKTKMLNVAVGEE